MNKAGRIQTSGNWYMQEIGGLVWRDDDDGNSSEAQDLVEGFCGAGVCGLEGEEEAGDGAALLDQQVIVGASVPGVQDVQLDPDCVQVALHGRDRRAGDVENGVAGAEDEHFGAGCEELEEGEGR